MEKTTAYLQAYVSANAKAKFKNICSEKGMTSSYCLRQLINKFIKEHE